MDKSKEIQSVTEQIEAEKRLKRHLEMINDSLSCLRHMVLPSKSKLESFSSGLDSISNKMESFTSRLNQNTSQFHTTFTLISTLLHLLTATDRSRIAA